ncbi:MAG: FMN-binding glutamate synthase family protein, partial [Flavisolibacter sp.]|nr:FMN-binding glutamate synthase family protein [Flavisolibacter sp.]
MIQNKKQVSVSGIIHLITVMLNAIILEAAYTGNSKWYWALFVSVPLLMIAIRDRWQRKHAIIGNFPLIGHLRYFFESIRPEIRQYFFESDLDGKPFNRRQ